MKIKIGDFVLIPMDKQEKLTKIQDCVEKEDILSFLKMVLNFLQYIWFTHGDNLKTTFF